MFFLGVVLVVIVFLVLSKVYPHEATRAQFGSAIVSLVVAVLFSVVLSNWYAVRRDKDNRLRSLRDQHFAQLKIVLRIENTKLLEIATQATKHAYVTTHQFGGLEDADAELWPDALSHDLANHFPDYASAKTDLRTQIGIQDSEFLSITQALERRIPPNKNLGASDKEMIAVSFVETCTGHSGESVGLRITDSGYEFEWMGGGSGNIGGDPRNPPRPSPDQIAKFQAYQALKPSNESQTRCSSLASRAASIKATAQRLSREAQALSEATILKGTCDLLNSDSLSD